MTWRENFNSEGFAFRLLLLLFSGTGLSSSTYRGARRWSLWSATTTQHRLLDESLETKDEVGNIRAMRERAPCQERRRGRSPRRLVTRERS
ncbi:UNVERIFIED_CONTAM: hypothetical protein Slati_2970400 [Sesamum latifolium]|uniref:Secreted protein n=1 Tax=Sesamum latifolium TaxID=2727402 RepID=A0AAW2VFB5_9LAMI